MKIISVSFAVMSFIAVMIYLKIYLEAIKKPKYNPNLTTWIMWVCADLINSYTYFFVVDKDIWEALFIISETIGIASIFIITLLKDKSNNTQQKVFIVTLFIIIFIMTLFIENKSLVNMIIQLLYIVGYHFTIKGIIKKVNYENIPSYIWGIIAAIFSIASILSNFHGNYTAFVAPSVMIFGDLLVIYFMAKREMKAV